MCEERSDEAPERSEERERQRVSATHELSDRGSERVSDSEHLTSEARLGSEQQF